MARRTVSNHWFVSVEALRSGHRLAPFARETKTFPTEAAAGFLVQERTTISGASKEGGRMFEKTIYAKIRQRTRETLGFAVNPHRSVVPQRHFGQIETQRTCEASRTCSDMHHSVQRKSIMSWRSRGLRAVLLLVPSKPSEKENHFDAQCLHAA
jgi:hypothetical protein